MRDLPLRLALIALAVAFVGLTAWSMHYFGRYQPFADLTSGAAQSGFNRIGLEISDAVVVGRAQGHRRWRVSARSIIVSRDRRDVSAVGIHNGILYDRQERPAAAVAAGFATYDTPTGVFQTNAPGQLHLDGGIHVTLLRPRGPALQTQSLTWDAARSQAHSPGRVTAVFPHGMGAASGLILQSESLAWSAGQTVIHTPSQVTATFRDGAGFATGEDVSVDIKTGNITLHRLHGTFRVPNAVQ